MKLRVYENPDGALRVLCPAPKAQLDNEDEAMFLARVAARAEAVDPSLVGQPWHDVEEAALPPREIEDGKGGRRDARSAWRLKDCRVVIDEALLPEVVDPDTELEAAISGATTLDQLKAALLGKTRPGKAKARPA